ncbi:beta-ketoacyl synthase N-terminal-like domain-containing protein [Streptomyces sp.]|uniref:beta-ketoacyl synthase N-terminal-like domain-containing protein n=2 Tax=Streptomyces sp. TaxID=1931 RepID=UPI0028120366|nr:beta-ketoacyl synthase N-terminal-like domain-containing protein [Streptomyces sp.]
MAGLMDPVIVTGVGAVTCHGPGADTLWRAMAAGAVRPPDKLPDPHARMDLPLMYLAPEDGLPQAPGRAASFAVAAAREALSVAGLDPATLPASRTALVLGTCMGGTGEEERRRDRGGADGGAPWTPGFDVVGQVATALGLPGAHTSVSNACSASGFALGMAADLIRAGEADVVVGGGADAYARIALGAFNRMGAVDPLGCRPFAADRAGTVFGEGAAVLVLESAAHAARRGARPLAELAESGWSCDAHHPTAPEPSGAQIVRAMRESLDRSGTAPDAVGCVVPHGTGTRLNDRVESAALREVFAGGAGREVPAVYSLKALVGHTGGAAAGLAAVAATLIVRHATVPPNVPVGPQDPECGVRLPQSAEPLAAPAVLVNAYAFGGNNASFLIREAVPC